MKALMYVQMKQKLSLEIKKLKKNEHIRPIN